MEKRFTLLLLLFFIFGSTLWADFSFVIEGKEQLTLYPNPAKDYVKIELQTENTAVPDIHIIDLTGKVVRKFDKFQSLEQEVFKTELDISSLNSGVYFVKVIQGDKVYSKKLIVE
jgi:hypothetical protein